MKVRVLVAVLLASACKQAQKEGGLIAEVRFDDKVVATCAELTLSDPATGTQLAQARYPRDGGDPIEVAIGKGDFPDAIGLRAMGLFGASGCEGAKPNSAAADATGRFVTARVDTVSLVLHPPTPTDDVDMDGYAGPTLGGPDCDDGRFLAHPQAAEACDQPVDLNCNNLVGCDDPACSAVPCVRPAVALGYASPAQGIVSGNCSGTIVVQTQDALGMPALVSAPLTVTLAEQGSLAVMLFTDSGCTLPASAVEIPRGMGEARFYARATVSGMTQLRATAPGMTAGLQPFTVSPGPAIALKFKTAPQTVKSSACSAAVTLETRDQSGNAAPVVVDTPVTLSATPATGISLFSDPGCSAALAAQQLAAGTATLTFYFQAVRTPATVRLDATTTVGSDGQDQTIIAGDPTAIRFVTAPQTVTAGVCSGAVTVKVVDALNSDAVATAQTDIGLSGPTMSFFADAACTTPMAAASIPPGMGQGTLYFTATGVGMPLVTAAGGGLTNATQIETVIAAAATKLEFATGPQGVPTTQCSGAVRLESRDPFNNPSNVTAMLPIALSANPPGGFTFYAGAGCTGGGITATAIAAGQSSVTLSFRGNTAGMVTVTADSSLTDPTQVETIGVSAPTTLVYLTGAQTRRANECSGAVTVESRDPGNNRSNVTSDVAITLGASPSTGFQFFLDSNCTTASPTVTLATGNAQATFYFRGTAAGPVIVTPNAMPTLTGPGGQTHTLQPDAATAIVFLPPARTSTAGGCAGPLTVESRDAFGNRAPTTLDVPLALGAAPGLTYHSDPTCTVPNTITTSTIANGSSQTVFYARGTVVPSYTLSAQHASVGMATQGLTITADTASQVFITTATQSLNTGQCSGALTFERRDPFMNVTTAGSLAIALSGSAGMTFYAACGGAPIANTTITPGSSTTTVFFVSSAPGMRTVTGTPASMAPVSQIETINLSPPTVAVITTPVRNGVPAGTLPSPGITVETQDSSSNPSPVAVATPVTVSVPAGYDYCGDASCVSVNPPLQISAGASTVTFYVRGTVAATITVTVTVMGFAPVNQMLQIVAGPLNALRFTSSAQTPSVGQCSAAATVQRVDQYLNPITAGGMLALSLSSSPSNGVTFWSASNCSGSISTSTILANQHSTTFYFRGTVPSTVTLTAQNGPMAQQMATFGAVAPDRMVFTTAAPAVTAGACSGPYTLESRDAFMNAAAVGANTTLTMSATPAANATFYGDSGCTVPTVAIPMGSSSTNFWLRATVAGAAYTITAQQASLGMVSQGLSVTAAAPSQMVFVSSGQSVRVRTCSAAVSVRLLDASGNTSNATVSTTVTPSELPLGGVSFFADSGCTIPLGAGLVFGVGVNTNNFYFHAGDTPQTVAVALASSPALTPPAAQNETVLVGVPENVIVSSGAKSLMAGECSGAMTVQARDIAGNNSNVTAATNVAMSASPNTGVTFYTDAACTNAGGTVQIPAGQSTVTFALKGITAGTVSVTATATGIPTPGSQNQNIAPAVRSGTCAMANGSGSVSCTINPALNADLTKTFFVFQATSTANSVDDTQVRCSLSNATTLACARGDTTAAINVQWYTVSRPTGLVVQHFPAITSTNTTLQTQAITAVNLSRAFVLASTSLANGGTTQLTAGMMTSVQLATTTTVELRRQVATTDTFTHSVQVVEWTGATVERGTTTIADVTLSATATVANSADPQFTLVSWRYGAVGGGRELCRNTIRAFPTNATTLTFTRGVGTMAACDDGSIELEWQRVRIPGQRIDPSAVSMAVAAFDQPPIVVSAVDLTRSLLFFSGNTLSGQSAGEASDTVNDRVRDGVARASFTDNVTVQVSRADAAATGLTQSIFTLYLWQVVP